MDFGLFAIFLAACGVAASTGSLFPPGEWYRALKKPAWTPPNRAFPVAWTTIYLMLAVAGARLGATGNAHALALWALQIALNTLWTPVFFGLHRKRAALLIMAGLWVVAVVLTAVAFGLDLWSGLLLVPYVAWLTVAAALNLSIVRNNPD